MSSINQAINLPDKFKFRHVFVYNNYSIDKSDRELIDLAVEFASECSTDKKIVKLENFYSFTYSDPEQNTYNERKVIIAFNTAVSYVKFLRKIKDLQHLKSFMFYMREYFID